MLTRLLLLVPTLALVPTGTRVLGHRGCGLAVTVAKKAGSRPRPYLLSIHVTVFDYVRVWLHGSPQPVLAFLLNSHLSIYAVLFTMPSIAARMQELSVSLFLYSVTPYLE